MCLNVEACHHLKCIMNHSVLIARKERQEKERETHQRVKDSVYNKKERKKERKKEN